MKDFIGYFGFLLRTYWRHAIIPLFGLFVTVIVTHWFHEQAVAKGFTDIGYLYALPVALGVLHGIVSFFVAVVVSWIIEWAMKATRDFVSSTWFDYQHHKARLLDIQEQKEREAAEAKRLAEINQYGFHDIQG